jgi:DNA-binding MarR family transcriptional regulator
MPASVLLGASVRTAENSCFEACVICRRRHVFHPECGRSSSRCGQLDVENYGFDAVKVQGFLAWPVKLFGMGALARRSVYDRRFAATGRIGNAMSGTEKPPAPSLREPKPELPFGSSVGYQLRMANRATQRYLQVRIEPHGVTPGMWYFLRALWQEDGLTQRELSRRIGTMEPTTLTALAAMEKAGLVTRERDAQDRRKLSVRLTEKGRSLKHDLLPLAREVVEQATAGFTPQDLERFLGYLAAVQRNLSELPPDADPDD